LCAAIVVSGSVLVRAEEHCDAKVNVEVEKTRNSMALRALASDAALSDANLMNDELPDLLHAVGVTTLRYPGRSANRYHWSTYKSTRIQGSDPAKFDYYAPNNNFGKFVTLLGKIGGTAILTVNYGSNLDGSGGGEPAEAAAWVAYCNGKPSDTKEIGKDSTGHDWKSVGYWATLRASAPLPSDDGVNFLRISHPAPLNIRYWEIGTQVFSNGFYMKDGQNNDEEDLHAAYGMDAKENEKTRRGNPKLSPTTYGNEVVEFAKTMKAVDPSIKIGAVLLPPAVKEAITKAGAQFVPLERRRIAGEQPGPVHRQRSLDRRSGIGIRRHLANRLEPFGNESLRRRDRLRHHSLASGQVFAARFQESRSGSHPFRTLYGFASGCVRTG